ncbi:PSL4 [Symbiodinium pilosum]|uniref:PSL4 protein n=1 Tax=Symbiodinium pilosum TaxID=2952 RepID=A0A812IU11_SYMPI|nr:PSL4 [Symbiodinium pilosum]
MLPKPKRLWQSQQHGLEGSQSMPVGPWMIAKQKQGYQVPSNVGLGPSPTRKLYAVTEALDPKGSWSAGMRPTLSRKGKLFALEGKLAAANSGLRWFSLIEQCVQERFFDKQFKVCFFRDARQGSVHLGSFDGWETREMGRKVQKAMLFTGGQRCPAGPPRSLKVWLTCSGLVELLDVSETSLCTYEAVASTPGACELEDLPGSSQEEVLTPYDDLSAATGG